MVLDNSTTTIYIVKKHDQIREKFCECLDDCKSDQIQSGAIVPPVSCKNKLSVLPRTNINYRRDESKKKILQF